MKTYAEGNTVYQQDLIDSNQYSQCISLLRDFFLSKGFKEVPTQSRMSILAACEDPSTVQTYNFLGNIWPLPQTGQMWLEYELLNKPQEEGFFCISTSYREEKNPISGRHKLIFPMFEFETHGTMEDLKQLEKDLINHLGLNSGNDIKELSYNEAANFYKVKEISHKEENKMVEDFAKNVLLTDFPVYTSPFWNMKLHDDGIHAKKVDVIIEGNETIGSAERSSNKEEMKHMFYNISDGGYAKLLFDKFGKERVEQELKDFLAFDFFPRCGGGIGITRMISALVKNNIIK
jgi:aspartyl/asparaginyl-tRNA synthetase